MKPGSQSETYGRGKTSQKSKIKELTFILKAFATLIGSGRGIKLPFI